MATYGVKLQRSDRLRLSRHPDAPTADGFVEWCHAEIAAGRPLAVDLFSGAGGLSLGLESAGWAVAAAVDNDPSSVETHAHNFPGQALLLDLSKQSEREKLLTVLSDVAIDLVAGGPPCQPFSRAGASKIRSLVDNGTRASDDPRRFLWSAFVDITLALKPRAVLMENVPDMAFSDDFRTVRAIVEKFEAAGYATQISIINTWDHGVPQHRRRLLVQARCDGFPFNQLKKYSSVNLGDAIQDLPPLSGGTGAREMTYVSSGSPGNFVTAMRHGAPEGTIHDHMTRPVREDDREIFEYMTSDMLYTAVPEHLRRYSTHTFDDKYKRLDYGQLSRTITAHIAKDGYWYIHPVEARTLTVREAARVQTFPDRFRFAGHRSDAFRQIGNAVPPFAGEAAANALRPDFVAEKGNTEDSDWSVVHSALDRWAATLPWSLRPGMGEVPAAVAAVLSTARAKPDRTASVMDLVQEATCLDRSMLDDAICSIGTEGGRRALRRLDPLVDAPSVGNVPAMVGMKPAEAALFSLFTGADVLLATTPTIRVASRFRGTGSLHTNMRTEGRIDLACLVGAAPDAPLRMTAIRHLGLTICGPADSPNCSACPLREWCAYRSSQDGIDEGAGMLPFEDALSVDSVQA
ncbi:DNA cytosine methyltransferase [Frankia sp. Cr2]|uniref:DNA cytosine methyltransferase n=1 Tax=Frankia sp. Cr2 TaxID=3073932 RepID=UPI002AD3CB3B|nr:DNA cytosine methyltransferase [Frankia sp. Cr2]